MRVSRRHPVSKRDLREILERLESIVGVDLSEVITGFVEMAYVRQGDVERVLIKDGKVMAFESSGEWFPTVHALLTLPASEYHRAVVVDMGAVKPIVSGVDVMVPGIVDVKGSFEEGDGVVVLDERNRRPLAVGKALMSSDEIKNSEKGRAIKNLHHVRDDLWEAEF